MPPSISHNMKQSRAAQVPSQSLLPLTVAGAPCCNKKKYMFDICKAGKKTGRLKGRVPVVVLGECIGALLQQQASRFDLVPYRQWRPTSPHLHPQRRWKSPRRVPPTLIMVRFLLTIFVEESRLCPWSPSRESACHASSRTTLIVPHGGRNSVPGTIQTVFNFNLICVISDRQRAWHKDGSLAQSFTTAMTALISFRGMNIA